MVMDSRLTLGQIVPPNVIESLQKLAEIEKPQQLADRKLQSLIMSQHKLKGVLQQMESMLKDEPDGKTNLDALKAEITKVGVKTGKAAEDLIEATIKGSKERRELKDESAQNKISFSAESPIDFSLSGVENFPLSVDSIEFDVQYFRGEMNAEMSDTSLSVDDGRDKESKEGVNSEGEDVAAEKGKTEAQVTAKKNSLKSKVTTFIQNFATNEMVANYDQSFGGGAAISDNTGTKTAVDTITAVDSTMSSQLQNHEIEGTLVIVASCTHKMVDIISPCIFNANKLLATWNMTFPNDELKTDPRTMFDIAFDNPPKNNPNALELITGCTRTSSFVGMAHVLTKEGSKSSESSESEATRMAVIVKRELAAGKKTGTTNASVNEAAAKVQAMMSSASIFNHCSLVTQGIIPNISSNEVSATVKTLNPTPGGLLKGLNAVKGAQDEKANDESEATTGAQFLESNNAFAIDTVSAISKVENEANQVLDTNSLMTAFTDYITKAQAGGCGTPSTFFTTSIDKVTVAKEYCNKNFPNGASTQKMARTGAIGSSD